MVLMESDVRKLRVLGWSWYKLEHLGLGCRVSVRTGKTIVNMSGSIAFDCVKNIRGIEDYKRGATTWASTENWKALQNSY